METAPLKSFATWARTALIREVTARIAVVLAPASSQRVEHPKVVAALEQAIATTGGGDKGRSAVADRVAYTWFNRIIALRFMDANNYTGIGVVSPQAGVELGQPEILAEAKRGNFDPDVVTNNARDTVTGLLNGSRRSDDAQGEAYALLLVEYCRHWNRAMPFMFERQGDFTELLIPANLLADDSVLNQAVKVLTETVCRDVEVIGWLYQFYISERKDEVFAGFKKNLKAGADVIPAATQLFTPDWIVRYLVENSLGRLWMLNHPTSRLVGQMEYFIEPADQETNFRRIESPEALRVMDPACGSGHMLTYAFDLLYAIYEEQGYTPSDIPRLILTNNLFGTEIDPRAGALAAFALTMKARSRQRTFLTKGITPNIAVLQPVSFTSAELAPLMTEAGDHDEEAKFWNLFADADVLGALIRPDASLARRLSTHLENGVAGDDDLITHEVVERARRVLSYVKSLTPNYSVVVANPPYMGSKNFGPRLADFAKIEYPDAKADLFAMFIDRCQGLALAKGFVGMITMQSWMFLDSFYRLRSRLLENAPIISMAHLGARAFDTISGEVVATTAFVLEPQGDCRTPATFVRLVDAVGEAKKSGLFRTAISDALDPRRFVVSSASLSTLPQSVVSYAMPAKIRELFRGERVMDLAHVHRGISTGNNDLYMRYWYEVSRSRINIGAESQADTGRHRWYPVNRGSYPSRWYGFGPEVLDYQHSGKRMRDAAAEGLNPGFRHDGAAEYFRETITWSAMTSGAPHFRILPSGFVIGHKGPGVAVPPDRRIWLLALLNSFPAASILRQLSGTLDILVGQIQQLPLPSDENRETVEVLAERLITYNRNRFREREDSIEFLHHPLLEVERRGVRIADAFNRLQESEQLAWEASIVAEDQIDDIFTSAYGLSPTADHFVRELPDSVADAESLVSYAVGCMFGRYCLDTPGLVIADQGASLDDYHSRAPEPSFSPDADNVIPVVDGDWFEDDIVTRFRRFLRIAFGEKYFEENLRFVTESLGVRDIRDYFVRSFYKDHVQRYRKRPIYWLFSSPKGSFNALIYMHRYTPSTVSTVLNEYLREFKAKLEATLGQQERLAAGVGTPRQQASAQKEADRIRKILLELDEYEHDVLYPLASQQIDIDLDDGVKANYPKFGAALKKIPGMEAAE